MIVRAAIQLARLVCKLTTSGTFISGKNNFAWSLLFRSPRRQLTRIGYRGDRASARYTIAALLPGMELRI